jgi:hypothetical protein
VRVREFWCGIFDDYLTVELFKNSFHPSVDWRCLVLQFAGRFIRFWKTTLWKAEDGTWMARLRYRRGAVNPFLVGY